MVTEGVIDPALDYLSDLKDNHSYSQEDLNNAFEDLLHSWEKITIFIKNKDTEEIIIDKAKILIQDKQDTFFMFARGNARDIGYQVLIKLQKESYLTENGYIFFGHPNPETTPPSHYWGFYSSNFLM